MIRFFVVLAIAFAASISHAQEESTYPMPEMAPAPAVNDAVIRMEPSYDLFAPIGGMYVPRLKLAPAAGLATDFAMGIVSWKGTEQKDRFESTYTGRQFFASAAYGFSGGFFVGGQLGYSDIINNQKSGKDTFDAETRGFMEPNLTVGKRFDMPATTIIASVDYSPKLAPRTIEQGRSATDPDMRDNMRGGSLTTPRLTLIQDVGAARIGAQAGYSWFGEAERQIKTVRRVFTDNFPEMKMIRYSAFAETNGPTKIGATVGYAKIDTQRVSSWAIEGYGAFAVNSQMALVPSLTFARGGTEGDLNDVDYTVLVGNISARASF